jgi:hypothetical protein
MMIDPMERWRDYGEKPDYAGPFIAEYYGHLLWCGRMRILMTAVMIVQVCVTTRLPRLMLRPAVRVRR